MNENHFDVVIVGGGLAGLTAAILLSRGKRKVLLIEKRTYPFHKVCGEYVSNEVLPFLKSLGFNPFDYGASNISRVRISTPSGKNITTSLGLGGFGLSRYAMDESMYHLALNTGATIAINTRVNDIQLEKNLFIIKTTNETYTSNLVIGSYGKRDLLDKKLQRDFIQSRTHYMGVKYHVKTDYAIDEVGLDNFQDGYCGIVKIEKDLYNLCYLYKRNPNFSFHSIKELEEQILFRNPVIRKMFENAEFTNKEPEVINEISFERKAAVERHILMCGDSAGLITPLCGNGMSMAIHAAKLLAELILDSGFLNKGEINLKDRLLLESNYQKIWHTNFSQRLFAGRAIQKMFGNAAVTEVAVRTIHNIPKLERLLINSTHGKTI